MGNGKSKPSRPPKIEPLSRRLSVNTHAAVFLVKPVDEEARAMALAALKAEEDAKAPPMVIGSTSFRLHQTKVIDPNVLAAKKHAHKGASGTQAAGSGGGGGGILSSIRKLVSKKKHRYQDDVFDLDLTYVTENIIAMGFPSEGLEGAYRNPMPEVQKFLDQRHPDSYKVYNLCSERSYDAAKFHDRAVRYPFDDHNCPPFALIHHLCLDAEAFLLDYPLYNSPPPLPDVNADGLVVVPAPLALPPAQLASVQAGRSKKMAVEKPMCFKARVLPESVTPVCVIHCKAGKGRTGLMICCLMLYLKMFHTADEALDFYGRQRTSNGKGVTIPSQQRYVRYYAKYLAWVELGQPLPMDTISAGSFEGTKLRLYRIRMHGVPNFDVGGGCDPYFKIFRVDGKVFYDHRKLNPQLKAFNKEPIAELECDAVVAGDVRVFFWDADTVSDDKMFGCWINTGITERLCAVEPAAAAASADADAAAASAQPREYVLTLDKSELDGPHKDKKCNNFPKTFRVEFLFRAVDAAAAIELHEDVPNNGDGEEEAQEEEEHDDGDD